MTRDDEIRLLAREIGRIHRKIVSLKLPRKDPRRQALEYELTKLKLRIRAMKTRPAPRRRLIPYAGAERD